MDEKRIKDIIASELAGFLLSGKSKPNEIQVIVYYPESVAKLVIDGRRFEI